MTNITTKEVQHLAELSSLRLDTEELNELTDELEAILGYVDQLAELDTDGVEPTYQVTGLENVGRQDVVVEAQVSRQQLLDLAPDGFKNNQIKVPKVLWVLPIF